jgi:hypothetical protein
MQGSLFDIQTESELHQKFTKFHEANPIVYKTLVRLARRAKAAGKSKIGVELLINVMRWEMWLEVRDPNQNDFKFSNDYKPFYARLIMENEEDLIGIFNIKRMWKNGDNIYE